LKRKETKFINAALSTSLVTFQRIQCTEHVSYIALFNDGVVPTDTTRMFRLPEVSNTESPRLANCAAKIGKRMLGNLGTGNERICGTVVRWCLRRRVVKYMIGIGKRHELIITRHLTRTRSGDAHRDCRETGGFGCRGLRLSPDVITRS
jgi:hypothetical protein